MISFGHARIENNANITLRLVNPPDIGLTESPATLPPTIDSLHRLQPDRLPENTL
ncbi:MAG: hypothetical protein QOH31_1249 [Verrucomicrobiota bacterium]|jgi:hypothetical protein